MTTWDEDVCCLCSGLMSFLGITVCIENKWKLEKSQYTLNISCAHLSLSFPRLSSVRLSVFSLSHQSVCQNICLEKHQVRCFSDSPLLGLSLLLAVTFDLPL